MDRLTIRNGEGVAYFKGEKLRLEPCEMDLHQVGEVLRKLAEYEDLEERSGLIKLPCKVGDTVYLIKSNETIVERRADMMFLGVLWEEFGKEWFLTKSEAEAKLKE